MPFKSEAQRAKMAELVKQGKLSQTVFDEFAKSTDPSKPLPERVRPKMPYTPKVGTVKKTPVIK